MKRPSAIKVYGLTGGIGSGKSEVARIFRHAGIPVLDADLIARELMEPGSPLFDEVVAEFGPEMVGEDGHIARRRLAEVVFSDPKKVTKLNEITHPKVLTEVERRLFALADIGHGVAVVEAALLVETGLYRDLDGLIVVEAPLEVRAERVAKRDGLSIEEVLRRARFQATDEERRAHATWTIVNDGSLEALHKEAARLAVKIACPSLSEAQ